MWFNLEVKEVDQIMALLMKEKWAKSNPLIQKILTQANDAPFQSGIRPPPAKKPAK